MTANPVACVGFIAGAILTTLAFDAVLGPAPAGFIVGSIIFGVILYALGVFGHGEKCPCAKSAGASPPAAAGDDPPPPLPPAPPPPLPPAASSAMDEYRKWEAERETERLSRKLDDMKREAKMRLATDMAKGRPGPSFTTRAFEYEASRLKGKLERAERRAQAA